jgi:DNA topoisomerase-1
MLASQMPDAIFDSTRVDIDAESTKSDTHYIFRATGSVMKFPGFRKLYLESKDEAKDSNSTEDKTLPELEKGDLLDLLTLVPDQHFTQPPPRYTEASIVRALEEEGIGRPSTYSPTIARIMDREYVRKNGGSFGPTKLGTVVNDLLTKHFPDIIDLSFTARMEDELDEIARGEREWTPVLQDFYGPFNKTVTDAMENAERVPRDQIDEESDEICDVCSKPMSIKTGRYGRFLSCTGVPECRNSKPLIERVGVECPKDGGDIVQRRQRGKGGRIFYGCSSYPNCDFAVNQRPLPQPCPQCVGLLLASGRENARCTKCEYRGPIPEEEEAEVTAA